MPIRLRKSKKIGWRYLHVALNFTQKGASSFSVKAGPWSWNSRTRAQRVDLPGPWHWTSKGRGRQSKGGKSKPAGPRRGATSTDRDKPADLGPRGLKGPGDAHTPGTPSRLIGAARERGHAWFDRRDEDQKLSRDERWLRRHEERRRRRHARRDRWVTLQSSTSSGSFATVDAFNAHLLAQDPTVRPTPAAPKKRRRRKATSRPPRDPQQAKTARLEALLAAWEPQINNLRGKAVENMNLSGAVSAIKEFGDTSPTGVTDMRERLVALEQIGLALQEAMEGFQTRARQDAHIAEEVVKELQPMEEAGEMVAQASTKTLAAFEDHYREDIKEAQAEQRVDNEFLVS